MSITVKKLIKPLVIIPILLITSFISIKPFQAYAEDDQPTKIEDCRKKRQEASDHPYALDDYSTWVDKKYSNPNFSDSFPDWIYNNCMEKIQSSHNERCCELSKKLGDMSNLPEYADICLDLKNKPNFSCEEDKPQTNSNEKERCLEIVDGFSTGHISDNDYTWYKGNCLNSDGTPKYSSQPSEQSNTPTPTNPSQNTPETPSQDPEPETPEPITFSSFEECYKYEYTAFLEQYKRPPINEQAALRKKCEDIIGAAQPETPNQDTPTSSPTEHCRYFLGMVSWDCNVSLLNQDKNISQDDLGSSIWTIAANIATDITVIAAYLVVGYIIYGGYLYIFSAGDTGKTATGKKAIHQALLGLAIVLSANIILNGIRIGLIGVKGGFTTSCVTGGCIEPADMVKNALEWVIGISGAVSAIFIVYGGTSYTMSRGDANKVQTAKQIITYALIGMIIVTLAELIVIFASNIINSANSEAYINMGPIITKPHNLH